MLTNVVCPGACRAHIAKARTIKMERFTTPRLPPAWGCPTRLSHRVGHASEDFLLLPTSPVTIQKPNAQTANSFVGSSRNILILLTSACKPGQMESPYLPTDRTCMRRLVRARDRNHSSQSHAGFAMDSLVDRHSDLLVLAISETEYLAPSSPIFRYALYRSW